MSYKEIDFKAKIRDPIKVLPYVTFDMVKGFIINETKVNNIPAIFETTTYKSGFLGSTKVPMLVIKHPTEKFHKIGVYMIDKTLFFPQVGLSYSERSLSLNPNSIKIHKEHIWTYDITCCLDRLL